MGQLKYKGFQGDGMLYTDVEYYFLTDMNERKIIFSEYPYIMNKQSIGIKCSLVLDVNKSDCHVKKKSIIFA